MSDNELSQATESENNDAWKAQCMLWCRQERDLALKETDYIHFPDVTIDANYKNSLITYRQSLRDFPSTFESTFDAYTETQKYGITRDSISEQMPTKPEE